jgi:hypothetical protein
MPLTTRPKAGASSSLRRPSMRRSSGHSAPRRVSSRRRTARGTSRTRARGVSWGRSGPVAWVTRRHSRARAAGTRRPAVPTTRPDVRCLASTALRRAGRRSWRPPAGRREARNSGVGAYFGGRDRIKRTPRGATRAGEPLS